MRRTLAATAALALGLCAPAQAETFRGVGFSIDVPDGWVTYVSEGTAEFRSLDVKATCQVVVGQDSTFVSVDVPGLLAQAATPEGWAEHERQMLLVFAPLGLRNGRMDEIGPRPLADGEIGLSTSFSGALEDGLLMSIVRVLVLRGSTAYGATCFYSGADLQPIANAVLDSFDVD